MTSSNFRRSTTKEIAQKAVSALTLGSSRRTSSGARNRRLSNLILGTASAAAIAIMSGQAVAQSAAEKTMDTLTAQWYNAVVAGLQLDATDFQLMQGNTAFGTTSDSVWAFFDAMPPDSVSHYYQPSRINSFAQTYGAVINNLIPQTGDDMQKLLANKYTSWEAYISDAKNLPSPLPKTSSGGIDYVKVRVSQFEVWGLSNGLNSADLNAGTTLLQQVDIISTAITEWVSAKGKYAYTASIGDVGNQINQGRSRSASLDSKTSSSKVTNSWAKGGVEGIFDIFGGEAAGEWSKFTSDMTNSGFKISASFDKVGTVLGGPYANATSTDPDLTGYEPWYNGNALKTAKNNNNNKVWKHTAPTWQQTFGNDGNMKREVSGLVVVDGVTITMTSSYSVATKDQEKVKTEFAAGFFPFFGVEGEGGWSNTVTFNNDGTFTAVSTSKTGNPQIIGVLVESIDHALSKFKVEEASAARILGDAAACNQIPVGELGQCTFSNGEQANRMNCAACCAQRQSLTWVSPGDAIAC
ncbi:MAG: hypothetical protein ABJL55_22800 [Roseibium sp.]